MRPFTQPFGYFAEGGVGRVELRYEVGDGLVSLLRVGMWLA